MWCGNCITMNTHDGFTWFCYHCCRDYTPNKRHFEDVKFVDGSMIDRFGKRM